MKLFYWENNNFGDIVAPFIVEYFWETEVERARRSDKGKLLSIGSVISNSREEDIVWGSGLLQDNKIKSPKDVDYLAVRGPLTKERVEGCDTKVYGDLGILLPLLYNPRVKKTKEIGIIPHFIDDRFKGDIDITSYWKDFIKEVKRCRVVASSSLHGIATAEAYGIPAIWIEPFDKIKGGEFKFQDYFLGTGRERQKPAKPEDIHKAKTIPKIKDIKRRQNNLINVIQKYKRDLVYVYDSRSDDHTNINYSVESTKNIPHRNIYIIGGNPEIEGTIHIPFKDKKRARWLNVKGKLLKAIDDKRISNDFVLMNDDFFIIEKQKDVKYYHLGKIKDWLKPPEGQFDHDSWKPIIKKIYDRYPEGNFYEVHYPVVFNKKKLKQVLDETPVDILPVTRTIYHNKFKTRGRKIKDFKLYESKKIKKNIAISSSPDIEEKNEFIELLEKKFPKIPTKKDVVYVLDSRRQSKILPLSIRTLKNINHRGIYIIGRRIHIKVNYIEIEDTDDEPLANVIRKLKAVIADKRISEDFILMNDDFLILQKYKDIPYYHQGSIDKYESNPYFKKRVELLKERFPDGKMFNIHFPIIYNKTKLKKLIESEQGIEQTCLRTYYCNYYNIQGEPTEDYKTYKKSDIKRYKDAPFLSTTDTVEYTRFRELEKLVNKRL